MLAEPNFSACFLRRWNEFLLGERFPPSDCASRGLILEPHIAVPYRRGQFLTCAVASYLNLVHIVMPEFAVRIASACREHEFPSGLAQINCRPALLASSRQLITPLRYFHVRAGGPIEFHNWQSLHLDAARFHAVLADPVTGSLLSLVDDTVSRTHVVAFV